MELKAKYSILAIAISACISLNAAGLRNQEQIPENQNQLWYAVLQGDLEKVQLLLEQGTTLDFQRKNGTNIFHYIAYWPDRTMSIAHYLCEDFDVGQLLNARDKNGLTPIMWARLYRAHDMMTLFKKHGAKISFKDKIRCAFLVPFKKGINSEPMLTSKFGLIGGLFQSIGSGLKRSIFGK